PFTGTFTFTSTQSVAVIALHGLTNERSEFLLSTLPVADISGTAATGPLVFPDFADGAGWSTQIALVNPTDNPLTGTIQFFDIGGNVVNLTVDGQAGNSFSYSIPARASQRLRTSGSAQSLQSGSVRITPAGNNVSPAGVVIFSSRLNGVTLTEAGVPAAGTSSAFRMYA